MYKYLIKSIHVIVIRDKRIELSSLGMTNLIKDTMVSILSHGHLMWILKIHVKGSLGTHCRFSSVLCILNPFSGALLSTSHISDNEAPQKLLKL